MSLHLVTGYRGSAHITSADQGAFNAGVVGSGDYVLETGKQFEAQVISNNQIRVLDGDISMQGRHICLKKDTFEDVVIANGLQGMNRNDLIVVRYTKDANTGVEDTVLVVIQGVSTDADASDPAYTTGDILSGECLLHEMPLYRVPLNGLNVGELVPLFKTSPTVNSIPQVEVTNETTVTTAGKALDARQANPNIEGSLAKQVQECFQSVSDGKSLVASAITDKGIETATDATFAVMAENITKIKATPIYTEATQATAKSAGSGATATATGSIELNKNKKYIVVALANAGIAQGGSNGTSYAGTNWTLSALTTTCVGATITEKIKKGPLYSQGGISYKVEEVVTGTSAVTYTAKATVGGSYASAVQVNIIAIEIE